MGVSSPCSLLISRLCAHCAVFVELISLPSPFLQVLCFSQNHILNQCSFFWGEVLFVDKAQRWASLSDFLLEVPLIYLPTTLHFVVTHGLPFALWVLLVLLFYVPPIFANTVFAPAPPVHLFAGQDYMTSQVKNRQGFPIVFRSECKCITLAF
jgi:hypothetical protein